MTTGNENDLPSTDLLFQDRLSAEEILRFSDAIRDDQSLRSETDKLYREFQEHRDEFSSDNRAIVRNATVAWILGKPSEAVELLDGTQPSNESQVVNALARHERGDHHISVDLLNDVYQDLDQGNGARGYVFARYVESLLKLNRIDDAEERVQEEASSFDDGEPNVPYLQGFVFELQGKPQEALDRYQEALERDPDHIPSLFREAALIDRQADEVVSSEDDPETYTQSIYERIMDASPVYQGAVMNLGLKYEDQGEYEEARDCYQMVLNEHPANRMAELYHGDAEASMNMSFREERMRERVQVGQLLNKGLTEFDFPERITDAFDQLNVETVGDLIQCTEDQLLACENFGEYSLDRVNKFLNKNDLSLAKGSRSKVTLKPGPPPEDVDEILRKKIENFDWSARSKRAMKRLSIYTLKDLVEHTEDELLDCQNFGETSLEEVKETLNELGLSLADES